MTSEEPSLPKVSLNRSQHIRLAVVGLIVALGLARVAPDFARVVYHLHFFGYTTDGDGVVRSVAPAPALPGTTLARNKLGRAPQRTPAPQPTTSLGERVHLGDKVRVDRIKPFDRKPGIAGRGFTYDNPERYLPIERAGTERILHLVSREESYTTRFFDMLRILIYAVALGLGAMLFLVKPSIATGAFLCFCLAGVEAPSTFLDTLVPNPWRLIPDVFGDALRGLVRPALLLFAFCLIDGDTDVARERVFAWVTGTIAVALAATNAYAGWRLTYAALPAASIYHYQSEITTLLSVLTALAFVVAFVRARRRDRQRIGWIVMAFLFAGAMRYVSDALYPGHIPAWFNSILVSTAIVPIIVVWIAVIRHQFFNVDFVVSRAVVYTALSAGFIGLISICEEIATYVFYQNTDLAYGVLILISLGVGMITARGVRHLNGFVDRFIFRDRSEQRQALEFIAGYILDAETVEDVYRALLQDAAHALKLAFGGILARQPDGSYELAESYNWPDDITIKLGPSDQLTRAITRTRGALTFSGKDTRLIQESFPNERLTFAAPLFFDRTVSGIVVYGHNVSGLDLDPDEREHLVRVVAHASIALNAIELNRYRSSNVPAALPSAAS